MDIKYLKEYIYNNDYIETILKDIGCHTIQFHSSGNFFTACNKDGDNRTAINVKNVPELFCTNYTRKMIDGTRGTDLIDLVCYNNQCTFPQALKYLADLLGLDYYHNFDDELPDSLAITDLIFNMLENENDDIEKPIRRINPKVLTYYADRVNDMFYNDGISYETQKEFGIGYDEYTNRITIPIFSEVNDLVGVKGRLFKDKLEDYELKYIYLEPCPKGRILYGLNKTMGYIQRLGKVYVVESEKAVMQLWSVGIRNVVACGGKNISAQQIEMLTRLCVDIVFAFDKDVDVDELYDISYRFVDGVPLYYIYDTKNILNEKESPTDNIDKWNILSSENEYAM